MLCWAQVMDMNREKTGALIAAARKEKNMTQKDLAKALHVSDRAVSKWERGAGFPDVGLLEPLADALGLQVLDLLRGEEQEEAEPEVTVRRALMLLVWQAREKTRRRWGQILGSLLALVLVGFVLFDILDRAGVFLRPVSLTLTATVYTPEGEPSGGTTVGIDGQQTILGDKSFVGQFAIEAVEATCREGVEGWQDIQYYRPGEFCSLGVERMLYITENLQSFGLKLEDGTIIATDPVYVPLLMSGYYYSIHTTFSNQF
nr:helix-turn-helix transcriptional regulator [uncultured Oscillibacter sp.]